MADVILLNAFQTRQITRDNDILLTLADIHWFLQRITLSLTGDERWNEKPSTIAEMTQNYIERKKLWDKQ